MVVVSMVGLLVLVLLVAPMTVLVSVLVVMMVVLVVVPLLKVGNISSPVFGLAVVVVCAVVVGFTVVFLVVLVVIVTLARERDIFTWVKGSYFIIQIYTQYYIYTC